MKRTKVLSVDPLDHRNRARLDRLVRFHGLTADEIVEMLVDQELRTLGTCSCACLSCKPMVGGRVKHCGMNRDEFGDCRMTKVRKTER